MLKTIKNDLKNLDKPCVAHDFTAQTPCFIKIKTFINQ